MGKMTFLDIHDGGGKIQLCFRYELLRQEKYELLKEFDIGDFMGAEGRLFQTKTGEITLEMAWLSRYRDTLSAALPRPHL
jgi:lysyl-tRNA synthetase class 2